MNYSGETNDCIANLWMAVFMPTVFVLFPLVAASVVILTVANVVTFKDAEAYIFVPLRCALVVNERLLCPNFFVIYFVAKAHWYSFGRGWKCGGLDLFNLQM